MREEQYWQMYGKPSVHMDASTAVTKGLTSFRSQGECCPRVLYEQDSQPQDPRQDPGRFLPDRREDQAMQS